MTKQNKLKMETFTVMVVNTTMREVIWIESLLMANYLNEGRDNSPSFESLFLLILKCKILFALSAFTVQECVRFLDEGN